MKFPKISPKILIFSSMFLSTRVLVKRTKIVLSKDGKKKSKKNKRKT